jgi:hypothetical protein
VSRGFLSTARFAFDEQARWSSKIRLSAVLEE